MGELVGRERILWGFGIFWLWNINGLVYLGIESSGIYIDRYGDSEYMLF